MGFRTQNQQPWISPKQWSDRESSSNSQENAGQVKMWRNWSLRSTSQPKKHTTWSSSWFSSTTSSSQKIEIQVTNSLSIAGSNWSSVSKWAVVAQKITAEEIFRQVSTARPLPSLQISDKVRVQTPVRHARLGVVRRPPTPEQPRSYIVTVNSKNYRRNRRNLLNGNWTGVRYA